MKLHIQNSETEKPIIGDMVYINSSGPLVDLSGNHAHPENNPVQILKIHETSIIKRDYKTIIANDPNYEMYNIIGQKIDNNKFKMKAAKVTNFILLKVDVNGIGKVMNVK